MGFFDRFRRNRDDNGYEYPHDRPVTERVDRDYVAERRSDGWLLPLLLIPAIALVGLGGYQLYRNYTGEQGASLQVGNTDRQVDTNAGVGVGGGPNSTATPTPTLTPIPTGTGGNERAGTGSARVVNDMNGGQQGVGGSGVEDELTPDNAPNTGRGE